MTKTTGGPLDVTDEPIVLGGSQHVDIRAVFCVDGIPQIDTLTGALIPAELAEYYVWPWW